MKTLKKLVGNFHQGGSRYDVSLGSLIEVPKEVIIGHPATLTDFHRWMNDNDIEFKQKPEFILSMEKWDMKGKKIKDEFYISYDSSKELLKQSDDTLKQIIELIKANSLSNQ